MNLASLGRVLVVTLATVSAPLMAADQSTQPAAPAATTQPIVRLWDGDAPGARGSEPGDIPTMTVFAPPTLTRPCAAMIVCPGGAYNHLAPHEGAPIAQWLSSHGIAAFVLRYRLGPKYHYPLEMEDVQRAIRLVRHNAAAWGVDPNRIGIIGFSAGGHLASYAATQFERHVADATDLVDRESARPDVALLLYPVITMSAEYTHLGSRKSLVGDHPDPALLMLLSSEKQVTASTPPVFSSPRPMTRWCRFRTAWLLRQLAGRRMCRWKFIFSSMVSTALGWQRTIPS
jgi:acetyl esterase/lipase